MRKREFVYPGTDLDRGRNLLALLGSFWATTYTGRDQLVSYTAATAEIVKQTLKNLYEVVAATSRHDVPVFHEELLTPLHLRQSDLNSVRANTANFDAVANVFDGTLLFDQSPQTDVYSFPLPDKLVAIGCLFNNLLSPTVALIQNTDFTIDATNKAITFAKNPFADERLTKVSAEDKNDAIITLWAFATKFDYNYVFDHFAYAIGLKLRSSGGYKELMNAVLTGIIDGGMTAKVLDTAISAICGIPLALDHETVEAVQLDRHGMFIATDKNVYRFNAVAEPAVIVGQQLQPGNYLVRGFEVSEFFTGHTYIPTDATEQTICRVPPSTILATNDYVTLTTETDDELALTLQQETCSRVKRDLSSLALGTGFLSACFWGDLVFENKDVPLEINADHPSGYTYVKFGVGGLPADVEHFFDEIHARGIARIQAGDENCPPGPVRGTLAHILDYRKNIEFEPTADTLPKTINPLRFLVENVLRNNVFVVRIIVAALGQNAIGLYNIRHLRALIPPQTAMIVVFELAVDVDKIYPDKITEETAFFAGAEPIAHSVPHTLICDNGATARVISGTCQ